MTANRRRTLFAAGAAVLVAALVAGGYLWGARADDDRQAEVAARGAQVMPFDLERTTHVFRKLDDGGEQTVLADDPAADQVALVREHLRAEAEKFRAGEFADPAAIHGEQMPGLAELDEGAQRIAIRYQDVPAGGRIRYTTRDPGLVAALHAWFDAQVADHGAHAQAER